MTPRKPFFHWALPHCYALIFLIIVLMGALTWVVPSGQFERESVRAADGSMHMVVRPGTYHEVPKHSAAGDLRQGVGDILSAPARGMAGAVDVVVFVLILGGVFGILVRTRALDRGLAAISAKAGTRVELVLPLLIILLSLGGSTFGMSEEALPLYAVLLPLLFRQGYDSMTTVLVLFLSTQVGYIASTINPFTVIIAQSLSGLTGEPHLPLRALVWLGLTGAEIVFVMAYARRVRRAPQTSLVYASDQHTRTLFTTPEGETNVLSRQDWIILVGFVLMLGVMVWGLTTRGWFTLEIGALFLGFALAAGTVALLGLNGMADAFAEGCRDFVYPAFVIGLGRGILVMADRGMIIDTILNGMNGLLHRLPDYAVTTAVLAAHNVITLLVPSSSGEAALTMPVMAPLAGLTGIGKDTLVLAYQFGNGLINTVSPTSPVLMASLALARIEFGQWLKVVLPFILAAWLACALLLAIFAHL
jgi:uncharacterized ion transporter superfamily protein YfcC